MSGTLTYGAFSDYLEKKILGHVFAGAPYTAPATLYLSLFTTASTDTAPGTEPAGGGYTRIVATFAVAPDQPDGSSALWNTGLLQFPAATAAWGTVGWVGIHDAASAGNMLAQGPLVSAKAVGVGDAVRFSANQLILGLQ